MTKPKYFSNTLSIYRRFAYTLFFVILILGIGGLIFWKWYALPIAIVLGIIVGRICVNQFYNNLSKRIGYDIYTLKAKMIEADDKMKGFR